MKKIIVFLSLLFLSVSPIFGQEYSVRIRIGQIVDTEEGWAIHDAFADVFDSNGDLKTLSELPSDRNFSWYERQCQLGPDFVLVWSGPNSHLFSCDGEVSKEGDPNPTITYDENLNFTNFMVKVVVTINGVDYSSGDEGVRFPDNGTGTLDQKIVTVKQRLSSSSLVGRIGKKYDNSFYTYPVPVTFTYPSTQSVDEIFRASQSVNTNEKYNYWAGYSNVINHKSFTFNAYSTDLTARFNPITNATVKANMPEYHDFELQFKDPWLIDDSDPLGPKNREWRVRFHIHYPT